MPVSEAPRKQDDTTGQTLNSQAAKRNVEEVPKEGYQSMIQGVEESKQNNEPSTEADQVQATEVSPAQETASGGEIQNPQAAKRNAVEVPEEGYQSTIQGVDESKHSDEPSREGGAKPKQLPATKANPDEEAASRGETLNINAAKRNVVAIPEEGIRQSVTQNAPDSNRTVVEIPVEEYQT
jgi:hypothetical protein